VAARGNQGVTAAVEQVVERRQVLRGAGAERAQLLGFGFGRPVLPEV
jgi:hypothetical protein